MVDEMEMGRKSVVCVSVRVLFKKVFVVEGLFGRQKRRRKQTKEVSKCS